ncbi:MAG: hypothetical protein PHD48_00095 [Alphaproteobacteria bacterium]|nr:hypothetical protein [Alphaproteobacteria bacterium]
MEILEKKTFFSSLGFLAVLLKGQSGAKNASEKAKVMGGLIEAFCHDGEPSDVSPSCSSITSKITWLLDRIIASIKTQMKAGQPAELPESQELKTEILERLHLRQRFYVGDSLNGEGLLDSSIVNFLEQEIKNVESEAKMMVVSIQGDPNAFAPYEHLTVTIANILRKTGKCSKNDLTGMGFTQQELENWNMAYALAHVDLMEG